MFEIGIITHFEAAHSLQGDFGPASQRHGHTYRVEITARGSFLHADGTLCDIGLLKSIASDVIGALNYQDLDEIQAFKGRNSTAEKVALHIFEQFAPRLKCPEIETLAIRVWESPFAFACYEGSVA